MAKIDKLKIGQTIPSRYLPKHGKQNVQTALNNFLWKIAMNNGGVISMSRWELDQIPPNAALASTYDSKTNHLMVKAVLRPAIDGIAKKGNGG